MTQTSGFVAILGIEDQFHNFGVQAHIYYYRHESDIRKSMTRIFISYCQPGRSGVTFIIRVGSEFSVIVGVATES